MRLLLYLVLLVAGYYGIAGVVLSALYVVNLWLALVVGNLIPILMVTMRAYIWYRRRCISTPTSFVGLPFKVAIVSASLVVLTVLAYGVLVATGQGKGLSGVPLGMLLLLLAPVAAITLLTVEIRDYLIFFASQRSNEEGHSE